MSGIVKSSLKCWENNNTFIFIDSKKWVQNEKLSLNYKIQIQKKVNRIKNLGKTLCFSLSCVRPCTEDFLPWSHYSTPWLLLVSGYFTLIKCTQMEIVCNSKHNVLSPTTLYPAEVPQYICLELTLNFLQLALFSSAESYSLSQL